MNHIRLLTPQTEAFLNDIGYGKMSSSAYDTAWIAQMGALAPNRSTKALEWLRANQLEDGSWGTGDFEYAHDRFICTLSSMIALARCGSNGDHQRVEYAAATLGKWAHRLRDDPSGETVGFELLIPTLADEAVKLGILPNGFESVLSELAARRTLKLIALPNNMISRHVTVAHSAEMVGLDAQILLDVENLQESNGCIGGSPAASAFFATHICPADKPALAYLDSIAAADGSVTTVAPIEIFEIGWTLWNLTRVYTPAELAPYVQSKLDILEEYWVAKRGIGWYRGASLYDGDDTAIVLEMLHLFGRPVDPATMLTYEGDKYFRCYMIEANPSISVNIHVLGALRSVGFANDHPSILKILAFLKKNRIAGSYWYDKWHTSPHYTTAHAVMSLTGLEDHLAQRAANWILYSQNADGSWGNYLPTAEETAYAIHALVHGRRHGFDIPSEPIQRAAAWLAEHAEPPYPNLWIGKSLYCPVNIVRSAILSALLLAEQG
jgi:halimadienyl-diphosphate synthase